MQHTSPFPRRPEPAEYFRIGSVVSIINHALRPFHIGVTNVSFLERHMTTQYTFIIEANAFPDMPAVVDIYALDYPALMSDHQQIAISAVEHFRKLMNEPVTDNIILGEN